MALCSSVGSGLMEGRSLLRSETHTQSITLYVHIHKLIYKLIQLFEAYSVWLLLKRVAGAAGDGLYDTAFKYGD